jgi:hypothetical protein
LRVVNSNVLNTALKNQKQAQLLNLPQKSN